jgi:hypothetical protein
MDRDLNAAINLEQLLYVNETTASFAEHLHRTAFGAVQVSHPCREPIRWRVDATMLVEEKPNINLSWIDLSTGSGKITCTQFLLRNR